MVNFFWGEKVKCGFLKKIGTDDHKKTKEKMVLSFEPATSEELEM